MDFFEHQERARRKTWQLVFLFSLAIASLIAGIYCIARAILAWVQTSQATIFSYTYVEGSSQDRSWWHHLWQWDAPLFWWVTCITLLIVTLGSIYKTLQLRSGGPAVATSLGGRMIRPSTKDSQERQLLNVVIEMAIASGTPTPGVYILDKETGINAFAAGHSPDDAVIGITQGALDRLSREELQGVIGHEFSHILNGDMRLNIHLMSLIHGILIIGLSGEILVRGTSRRPYGLRMGRHSGKEGFALMIVGLSLMAIGYLGVFFGNLIKAAVSRQREYLADASATQFTRHPTGLANALKKISGFKRGSVIRDPQAQTVSHMFFSQAFTSSFTALLATHPPLSERIRRLEPRFDGRSIPIEGSATHKQSALSSLSPISSFGTPQEAYSGSSIPCQDPFAQIGNPTHAHLLYAHELLELIPDPIRRATEDSFGARALVYALLMNIKEPCREVQVGQLHAHADPAVYRETILLLPLIRQLQTESRLPLIDMLLPSLQSLSGKQYLTFKKNIEMLIIADQKTDLFEWSLRQVLLRHLEPFFREIKKPIVHYSLTRLGDSCAILLSALAYQTGGDHTQVTQAFKKGNDLLPSLALSLCTERACSIPQLDHAIETLHHVSLQEKRKLLQACAACCFSNNHISVGEGELLRAIADALGCPMPPLLEPSPAWEYAQH